MKFRAKRTNMYQKRHYAKDEVKDCTASEVEAGIALGRHKKTNKPMSPLLNHWEATDREAEKAVEDFIKAGRAGRSKAPEEAADEKAFDLIAKINAATTPEALSDMVQPGETRRSVLNAFNTRSEVLVKHDSDPKVSSDTTAAGAVIHIEQLQTVEAVEEFAKGDERVLVVKAVKFMTKKLGG
ncbi:hypothetical protein LCGC14_1178490 [marine sediment metagenome]|uniref:Uncharacterized protein n=1 Tax=marine sediment metagenome TaxID=412755 RepID=A0A0F9P5T4_9ZZZZ